MGIVTGLGTLAPAEEEWTAKAIHWAYSVLTGDAKELYWGLCVG